MIPRFLEKKLIEVSKKFPVVAILGPRQSGKTTLAKATFPQHRYVSLEDLDTRSFAEKDPRGFLQDIGPQAILDEIQRVPSLFSYIQTQVDSMEKNGVYILTGSHNYLLQTHLSQSLAGRVALLTLLPFEIEECAQAETETLTLESVLWKGSYPRIYDQRISPLDWYPNYIRTYIERDIKQIQNIENLSTFQKFLQLCAGRIGHQLNLTSLGLECGISHTTARQWISLLESSYIVFLLKPYHQNFNKQLTKMPKLYFHDTGLACSLLGIESVQQLTSHYLYGGIFENFIISELYKYPMHRGRLPRLFFWRDKTGHEVDCIIDGQTPSIIEIKSGKTIHSDFFKGLTYWQKIASDSAPAYLIYGGTTNQNRTLAQVLKWEALTNVYKERG